MKEEWKKIMLIIDVIINKKSGKDKYSNDTRVEKTFLDNMIRQQLYYINREDIIDYRKIVNIILVSQTKIELFYKNSPIKSIFL